jgi:uncharacterized protein (DUF488 family)
MSKTLYTIGHSNHPIEHFIALLQQHAISAVGDVRSQPYSRFNLQYNRETLKQSLQQHGIAYVFLGKELGARSTNPDCYIDGRVQYHLLARQPVFHEGLERLRTGMQDYRIALMCAEQDPLQCHRTGLIGRELRGELSILHILGDGAIETNAGFEQRLLALYDIAPDLLRSPEQCLRQAYDQQAAGGAYVQRKKSGRNAPEQ